MNYPANTVRQVLLVSAIVLGVTAAPMGQAAVGRTATSWSVSSSGEAAYAIPIWSPPGTAGMTPSMSLAYGHRNGGSLTGQGWGVAGLSAISRCNKTWAQDGVGRNVKLDAQDRFCLNGNQLKLVSGTYGADGSEYRTEIETYSRIKSYGVAGTGPAYFIVESKDGLIAEYGNTPDSRIESVGSSTARAWLINKRRDRRTNYISYVYTEDATLGGYRIASVSYTGNTTQAISPAYQIAFVYETQPANEVESGYLANGLIKDITRMTRVDVTYNATLVRRYNLAYEGNLSSASRSRLASITECAGSAGTDCYPATGFSYQNGSNSLGAKLDVNTTPFQKIAPLALDINGDGRLDIAYASNTSGTGTWMIRWGTATGFGAAINSGITASSYDAAVSIDYDGDGFGDILVPYSGTTWWVLRGTASGFAAPLDTGITASAYGGARACDIDGDGLDDFVYANGTTIFYRLRVLGGTYGPQLTLVAPGGLSTYLPIDSSALQYSRNPDFDGDGRDDIVYVNNASVGGGVVTYTYAFLSGSGTSIYLHNADAQPIYADLNLDGLTDILTTTNNTQLYYRLSTGTTVTPWLTGPAISGSQGVTLTDWDGDGFDDVLVAGSGGTWQVSRSSGEGLTALVAANGTSGALKYGYAGDVDGDGQKDAIYYNWTTGVVSVNLHAGVKPDYLTTATDGFGNSVTFSYTTTAQNNYTKLADAVFPYMDYQGTMSIVSQYAASNGVGGSYTMSFWYTGAWLHRQGRGLTGFNEFRSTDSRNNLYRYRNFERSYPKTGMSYWQDSRPYAGGPPIARDQATNTFATLGTGFEVRYAPYASQTIHTDWESGGAFNASQIRTVTTNNSFDSASGTIYDATTTTVESSTGNGATPGQTWTSRTWISNLQTDTVNWCLGKPNTLQQINSHSGYSGTSVTRTTGSTWDMVQCRPTQTQVQPSDPSWQVTTVIGYDAFGNVNSQAVTGIGMTTRTTTTNWGANGQFPVSSTNPLNQTTTRVFNAGSGTLASETDPNNLTASWLYDNFARKTRETRRDGTYTDIALSLCAPGNCGWNLGYWSEALNHYGSNSVLIKTDSAVLDAQGRTVQSVSPGVTGGLNTVSRYYDALGRVAQESMPYVCCASSIYWITNTYDLLDRLTQASRPINATNATPQTTSNYYEGLTVRVLDAQSRQTKAISNAAGQVRRTVDHNNYYKQFDVDAFGNVVRVQDSLGNTNQSASFNVRGLRYQSVDSDMGTWNYVFNALGEMTRHTDAKGQQVNYTFDLLGRMTQKTEPSPISGTVTNIWTWGVDPLQKNIGKLYQAEILGGGLTNYRERSFYDSVGRPSSNEYFDGSTTFAYNFAYNALGQLELTTYPISTSGYRHQVVNIYAYGQLKQVRDGYAGQNYWTANAVDALGHVTNETLANYVTTTRSIDAVTGLPSYIQSGAPGGGQSGIQNLNYAWDLVGNLTSRNDANQSLTEAFVYDNLYRLDYSTLNGIQNLDVNYDALGNITSKSDVGTYTYAGPRLHAVTNVAGVAYNYDANGNITSRGSSTVTWYAHNRPYTMSNGTYTSTFEYGPNGNYWKQTATYSNGTETTKYIGGLLEIVQGPSVTSYRHHIKANGRTVAVYSRGSNGANNTIYPLNDHLGSTDAVTNSSGTIVVKESFAAFGARRNGATWSGSPSGTDMTAIGDATRRGYTDHSMLDNIGLVHMNGRVMDPVIGRFVSADKRIDVAMNTQGWNRYAYVKNNPLSATDPTGHLCVTSTGSHICREESNANTNDSGGSSRDGTGDSSSSGGFFSRFVNWIRGVFGGSSNDSTGDTSASRAQDNAQSTNDGRYIDEDGLEVVPVTSTRSTLDTVNPDFTPSLLPTTGDALGIGPTEPLVVPFTRLPTPQAPVDTPRLPGESDWEYQNRRRSEHEAREADARAAGDLAEADRQRALAEINYQRYWNSVLRDIFQFPERSGMLFEIPDDPKDKPNP